MPEPVENKVQFGLKNVYYAKKTGANTWATPKRIPGAVNLNLKPEGELKKFYADDMLYYRSHANNGYSGDIEFARIPDEMRTDIWGMTTDTNGVIKENANVEEASFALLFEIDGDENQEKYCLFDVNADRPPIASKTKEDSKDPQTTSLSITAAPLENGDVFIRTTKSTDSTVKTNWYSSVYTGPVSQGTT